MSEPDTSSSASLAAHLCARLPVQIVVVGDLPQTGLPEENTEVTICRCKTFDDALLQIEQRAQQDLPELQNAAEVTSVQVPVQVLVFSLDFTQQNRQVLLGKAVRACPHRVIVRCSTQPGESVNEAVFFALGFTRLPVTDTALSASDSSSWFEYRLSQYKAAPDWLNSRFWANPERFHEEEEPDIYCDDSDDESGDEED